MSGFHGPGASACCSERSPPAPRPRPASGPRGVSPPSRSAPRWAGRRADLRPTPSPTAADGGRTRWSAGIVALGAIAFCSFFAEGTITDWSAVYLHDRAGPAPPWPLRASRVLARDGRLPARRRPGRRRLGRSRWLAGRQLAAACGLGLALAVPVRGRGAGPRSWARAWPRSRRSAALSAAGASGQGVESAISRVLLLGYTGSIAGPAAIGFAAGRVELRAALVIPLALIVVIVLAAGRIDPAPGGELART